MSNEDSSKCNIELEISLPDISTSSNASTSNVSEKDSSSEDVISEGSSLSPEFATSDCSLVEGNGFCEDSSLFEDLLQHGGSSDVVWCFKNFCPTLSRSVNYRVPIAIIEAVLKSNRVSRVVSGLAKGTGRSTEKINSEAAAILAEMGHKFSMSWLSVLGGIIRKLFKQIVTKVVVNKEGMSELQRLSSVKPLLLLPTHRSYLDFILVTWLMYSYGIRTPIIAAGQDFMFMSGVGALLRRCGAFFIRRSFGKDKLYWTLFTEYTQTHIVNRDAPVEFFIEGTRSRTGKSLQPKFGMLTVALEPYFDGRVSDIAICPITLSYEKTIEEALHVREMLGIPKPSESTSGLIQARHILNSKYGAIHIRIGQAMSVSRLATGKVDRKIRSLGPRSIIPPVPASERSFVHELAYKVILEQQANSAVFPCSVLAAVLLYKVQNKAWKVSIYKVEKQVNWVGGMLLRLGCNLLWDRNSSKLEHMVKMLSPAVLIEGSDVAVCKNPPCSSHLNADIRQCYSLISLGRRRNEFLHSAAHVSILAKVLFRRKTREQAFMEYSRLRDILCYELIIMPNSNEDTFDKAIEDLLKLKFISKNGNLLKFNDMNERDFLNSLIEPFLLSYLDSWNFCISNMPRTLKDSQSLKSLCIRIQTFTSARGLFAHGESVNLNVIENSILSLAKLNVVCIDKVSKQAYCLHSNLFSEILNDFYLSVKPLTSKL